MRRENKLTRQPDPRIASLACGCGCTEIMAIRPGQEPEHRGAVDLFTRLDPIVTIGVPDVAWCAPCWMARFASVRAGLAAS